MIEKPEELPSGAGKIARTYPAVWEAYAALGKATAEAGPLDERTRRSHARRALEHGITKIELKQVALLATVTLGLPQAVRGLTWIEDITDPS